jgi:geranylgeranyl reductase family protein
MYDVVVVGGGPVGSHAASRLSAVGYRVAVIEKKADFLAPVCCTGIISEECFHKYNIDHSVVYRHVNSASIFSPSNIRIRVERPLPQAVILNRPFFNQYMAYRAQQQGTVFFQGIRVNQISVFPDMVTITTDSQQENTISAKTVIVATGSEVSLLKNMQLPQPAVFAAGAQAEVNTSNVSEVEVYTGQAIAPGYFAWLVPTSKGKALAGLLVHRQPAEYLRKFLDKLISLGKILPGEVNVITGAVPVKAVSRTYTDRILVTGTAAGLVKSTTGGGIYYGLLNADIAADVIQQSFAKNTFDKASFQKYQHQWQTLLSKELQLESRARLIYEHLNDSGIDRLFDIINKNNLMNKLLSYDDVSFDWHSTAIRHLLQETTLVKLLKGVKLFFPGNRPSKDSSTGEES